MAVIQGKHKSGPVAKHSAKERERVLAEARRRSDPEKDGTKTWSLTTLQKALRKAPDGLPEISTERIWVILCSSHMNIFAMERPRCLPCFIQPQGKYALKG